MTADDLRAMMGPVPEGWEVSLWPASGGDPCSCATVHIPDHGTECVYAMPGAWLAGGAWWPGMEGGDYPPPPKERQYPTLVAALTARWRRETAEHEARAADHEARARHLVALAARVGDGVP